LTPKSALGNVLAAFSSNNEAAVTARWEEFMRLPLLRAALVMVGLTASALAADPGVTDSEIKIGVHFPLTGPASFVGQGAKVGIETAAAEINGHGGINGRKLVMVYADDRGTPDGGVTIVRRLVDEDKVFAVFGASTSTATVSVLPYFMQNGVPYYVSLASDPRVLEKFAPNIYSGSTMPQTSLVVSYVKFITEQLKPKKVGLLQCDQAHCTSGGPLLKAQLEKAGISVTQANFNSGDTDFTGQIQQIKSAQPDAVFIFGLASDGGRIMPQLRRAGITAPLLGDTSLADLSVGRVAGKAADGFYTFWLGGTQFLDDKTGPMGKLFASMDALKIERPNNTPNLYTLLCYSDVYVLAEGLRGAGKEPTRAGLMQSLDNNVKDFMAGKTEPWTYGEQIGLPRTFTPTNHQGTQTLQVVVYKDGQFKPVSAAGG
jgi:branched-chain amino acid transport system substrate-binding protein